MFPRFELLKCAIVKYETRKRLIEECAQQRKVEGYAEELLIRRSAAFAGCVASLSNYVGFEFQATFPAHRCDVLLDEGFELPNLLSGRQPGSYERYVIENAVKHLC